MSTTKPLLRKTIYVGPWVHCKTLRELHFCDEGAIGVDERGVIAFLEERSAGGDGERSGWEDASVVKLEGRGFFFPGFIDTHIHASQYPNAGIFGKSTLLDWLQTYTFPLESSLSDFSLARRVYSRVVSRTLAAGTTTAAYYATIDVAATNLLASLCHSRGQRALVGRVCMDSTLSPAYYRDASPAALMAATRACIAHVRALDPDGALVAPVLTPRFAPSCSPAALALMGRLLADDPGLRCQTHVAETKAECALVAELFPDRDGYVAVYDGFGLLTHRTVLAHAVHLTDAELGLVVERGAKVSHCATSNTALTSGCCGVRRLIEAGVDVGLGTDVSGGFSVSVLEAVRHTILVSRHVAMAEGDAAKLGHEEALFLATRGGANVLGLADRVGGFEVGMEWDAQMVCLDEVGDGDGELDEGDGPVDLFGMESFEDVVAKWVYNGNHQNTAAVWVKGRLVHKTGKAGVVD